MKVPLSSIKSRMTIALQAKGYSESDIPFLINMYLGGELRGHSSHGLASFPGCARGDFSQFGKHPEDMTKIIGWLNGYDEKYRTYGAVIIDAMKPLDEVVDEILQTVSDVREA